ncbi:hypothetical protein LJC55_03485 [Eubacteriales bacterium OttesenSCG-928-N14]|nr:hypothetical protein [Eubacteriales bacterium OttesenSCG-928-N14]
MSKDFEERLEGFPSPRLGMMVLKSIEERVDLTIKQWPHKYKPHQNGKVYSLKPKPPTVERFFGKSKFEPVCSYNHLENMLLMSFRALLNGVAQETALALHCFEELAVGAILLVEKQKYEEENQNEE